MDDLIVTLPLSSLVNLTENIKKIEDYDRQLNHAFQRIDALTASLYSLMEVVSELKQSRK